MSCNFFSLYSLRARKEFPRYRRLYLRDWEEFSRYRCGYLSDRVLMISIFSLLIFTL